MKYIFFLIFSFVSLISNKSLAQEAHPSNNFYNSLLLTTNQLLSPKEINKKYRKVFKNPPIDQICGCKCNEDEMYYHFGNNSMMALVWREKDVSAYMDKLTLDLQGIDFLFNKIDSGDQDIYIFTESKEKNRSANFVIVTNKANNESVVSLIYYYNSLDTRTEFLEKYAKAFNFNNVTAAYNETTVTTID